MTTTVLATALPHSLADDAPFQLTVFVTHKLVDGPPDATPASPTSRPPRTGSTTLAGCTLTLTTSLGADHALPLRVVSAPPTPPRGPRCCRRRIAVDGLPGAGAVGARRGAPTRRSRMSDHAVDLHLAAITAAPTRRPGLAGDPVAERPAADAGRPRPGRPAARGCSTDAHDRARRALQVPGRRLARRADDHRPARPTRTDRTRAGHGSEVPPLPPYQSEIVDRPSPIAGPARRPRRRHRA